MRYGIFSDVHSNLEAFKVAVAYYQRCHIDKYIFVGDLIGYGPKPIECISLLRDLNPVAISGNHEWGILDKLPISFFNQYARASLVWSRKYLTPADMEYFLTFSLKHEEGDFVCVHGSLMKPEKFYYIASIDEAEHSFSLMSQKICFVGHSHRSAIFSFFNGTVSCLNQRQVDIEPDKKYIINIGSVGQPRDMNTKASVCIYDSESKTVRIDRLDYKVEITANQIRETTLPSALADRLIEGW